MSEGGKGVACVVVLGCVSHDGISHRECRQPSWDFLSLEVVEDGDALDAPGLREGRPMGPGVGVALVDEAGGYVRIIATSVVMMPATNRSTLLNAAPRA